MFREVLAMLLLLAIITTLYLCVDRVSDAVESVYATCPGPLQAGDYYTPED